MNKIITILLFSMIVLNFAACSKSDAEKKDEQVKAGLTHFKATPMPDPKDYKEPKF